MEQKTPYLFTVYPTRESVPSELRVNLITPYDPTIPQKVWSDPTLRGEDEELVNYTVFKRMANGNIAWNDEAKRPLFRNQVVLREYVDKLNIPPKDFSGRIPEAVTNGVWDCPVRVTPPEGYEWSLSLGLTPIFVKTVSKPATLEDIAASIKSLHEKVDRLQK